MIDFHCHLDLYNDPMSLVKSVAQKNVFTLVVTTSPKAWKVTSRKFSGYKNIEVALGLHPEIVAKKINERDDLIRNIANVDFIGEVGIDGSKRYQNTLMLQKSLFDDILKECEKSEGKIISIHSRKAESDVLNLIQENCVKSKPVLHWFSGTKKEARRALELGCWFSIGPAMLNSNKGYEIVKVLPKNKVVPETDGPFAKIGYRPLMPGDAFIVVEKLASLWDISIEEVHGYMKTNLRDLL